MAAVNMSALPPAFRASREDVRPRFNAFDLAVKPPPPPPPLPEAPTLGDVSPAPGSPLEKLQPISLRVTDIDGDLRRVVLLASFRGLDEWVFDGVGFSSQYAGSASTGIAGGLEFVLRRAGGWPSSPTLRVRAYDAAGSEL